MSERQRGNLGGAMRGGRLLDSLVVRIDVDMTGFRRGIAEAIAQIRTLRGAIAGQVGGASLGDAMTAALVAPMAIATARIGQMRNELRSLTNEMRQNAGLLGFGGPAPGGRSMGAIIPVPGGGPIIDAQRAVGVDGRPVSVRGSGGRMVRGYDATGSDDLLGAARGVGSDSEQPRPRRGGFRGWLGGIFGRESERTAGAFERGRDSFPGMADAEDNLGGAGRSIGAGGRRLAGSRIAQMFGLVGLGAMFGDLIRLAASLATVIGGTLAGAFSALLTPLGAVVGLVTALVALFVASNWDSFREFGEWFANRWRDIVGGEGMGDVIAGWNSLKGAFTELWDTIRVAFRDDSGSVTAVLQFFGEVVIRVVNAAMELLGGFLRFLGELVRAVAAMIRGDWADAWNHLGAAVETAFRTVLDVMGSLFPEIQQTLTNIADWVVGKFEEMGRAASSFWERMNPRNNGAGFDNFGRIGGGGGDDTRGGGAANDNLSAGGKPVRSGRSLSLGVGGMAGLYGDILLTDKSDGGFAFTDAQAERMQRMSALVDNFGYSMTRAFDAGVQGGMKFSDILRQIAIDIVQMLAQMVVIEPLSQQFGSSLQNIFSGGMGGGGKSGKGGGFLSAIGNFFGGFFAEGGYLAPGKWGIVGENGPEIAFGGRHGQTIVPGGANDNTRIDARSFIDARGADPAAIARLEAAQARRDAELPRQIAAQIGNLRQRGRL